MKMISTLLFLLAIVSCSSGKEKIYTGSTPAGVIVKTFLEIPLNDSIDFIRWKLTLRDNQYQLFCNYGIGKNNTNGFINGGKKVQLNGVLKKEKSFYQLQSGDRTLQFVDLNGDLLHLLSKDNSLLVGNGGWSYTLNNIAASGTGQLTMIGRQTVLKDSMDFEGRTPCKIPGIIRPGMECYKLKWRIIFYSDVKANKPTFYKVFGTPWRDHGGRTGNWKIVTGKEGRVIYQMNDEKGDALLYLLKLDENILIFTDANGRLLAGDEDFSYTLNRRNR